MSQRLAIVIATLAAAGCASTPAELPIKGRMAPAINGVSMSCSKPYPLSQDCSGFSGAKHLVMLDGVKVKVAGTADGTVVLAMTSSLTPSRAECEAMYDRVVAVAARTGAATLKTEVVGAGANVMGYVFTYDRDVYSVLKAEPATD